MIFAEQFSPRDQYLFEYCFGLGPLSEPNEHPTQTQLDETQARLVTMAQLIPNYQRLTKGCFGLCQLIFTGIGCGQVTERTDYGHVVITQELSLHCQSFSIQYLCFAQP